MQRLKAIGNNAVLGATGEISDFQAITQLLDRLMYSSDIHNLWHALWDDKLWKLRQILAELCCYTWSPSHIRSGDVQKLQKLQKSPHGNVIESACVIVLLGGRIADCVIVGVVAHRIADGMWDDGNSLGPLDIHNFLTNVMYNRRNKMDPLWTTLVLGGVKNGVKYLGSVSAAVGFNFVFCSNRRQ